MDNIIHNDLDSENTSNERLISDIESEEEDESFDDDFFDDERMRKPKGKKLKRMRFNFDR